MITIVETQTDAKDPGALPQTQIHPGSTATSQFAVSIYSCLFVCGWIHYHLSCMLRSSLCPSVSGSVAAQCGSTKYDWLQQNLLLPVPFILPFLPSSWLMLKNIQTHTHPPTHTNRCRAPLPSLLGLALCYVFSDSQNVYFFPCTTGFLFIVLCQLLCVVVKLHRSELLLYINLVLHMQTQHQGHTHYKQIIYTSYT